MKAKILVMLLVVTIIFSGTTINALADSCPRGGPHYGSEVKCDNYKMEQLESHMHITAYIGGEPYYELCERTAQYRLVKDICVKCNGILSSRWVLFDIWHSKG